MKMVDVSKMLLCACISEMEGVNKELIGVFNWRASCLYGASIILQAFYDFQDVFQQGLQLDFI